MKADRHVVRSIARISPGSGNTAMKPATNEPWKDKQSETGTGSNKLKPRSVALPTRYSRHQLGSGGLRTATVSFWQGSLPLS